MTLKKWYREASLGLAGLALAAAGAEAARPAAGSATAERVKVPSGPSSVRGLADEPAVDPFYAQVDYEVPIELPGGIGGLAPRLGLTYSGALGNGPIGIGWSLSEAKIQRSLRRGVPAFTATDELELVGIAGASGRLVPISATEYRIEGLGNTVRVLRVGDGFALDDGNGTHYKLGQSAAARQAGAGRTTAWLVEEQTNLQGERIRYDYVADQGQVYLGKVSWGPQSVYTVDLAYEGRADRVRSYREGFLVITAKRLKTITVSSFGTVRRAYQLAYEGGTDTAAFPVSRLAGVTSTGVAGAGAWPALSFTYAAPAAAAVEPITGVGAWRLNTSGTTLVDLDGDGAAELLQLAPNSHSYLINRNGGFGANQPLTGNGQGLAEVQLHDLDGDARVELVRDTGNGWAVFKFARTQWVPQAASLPNGVWPGTVGLQLKNDGATRFADLNGDGLTDAMRWDNDNLKVHFATRTGFAASINRPWIGGTVVPTGFGRFQDANGDGLDDYLVVSPQQLDVFIGRGDGTFDAGVPIAYPFAGTVDTDDIELADLDRDGLIDLVRGQGNTVTWYRGKPDGTFRATGTVVTSPETLNTQVVIAVADTNGNGSQDVVWSSTNGMWRLDLAGTTTAGMLKQVTNGLGMTVSFDYASSHALAVAAADAGSAWTSHVPVALPVPIKKTTALGAGETTREVGYSVRDGFWDAAEQRFAGFLATQVTTAGATPAQTGVVITSYASGTAAGGLDRMTRGKPTSIQVRNGAGVRLSLTQHTWTTMPVQGLDGTNPLLRRAITTATRVTYDDVTPKIRTDVTYQHDVQGRQIRATDAGRNDLTGDESVIETRYTDDGTTWIRDRVCEEKLTDANGIIAKQTQYLFGDETAAIPAACSAPGKGWLRRTQGWLGAETRWVTRSETAYDLRGNPTATTERGVERRFQYDPTGLFAIDERVTRPGGGELVWTAAWNPTLGAVRSVTDPDGHTTTLDYDALGRLTATALDARPPHQVIEYDWSAPFPKTTVWSYDGPLAAIGAKPSAWSPTARWRQRVEVANGRGEVRYRAVRLGAARWIVSDYQERDPASRVTFRGQPVYTAVLDHVARPAGIAGDTLAYDPLGRLLSHTSPTGAARTYSYLAFERTTSEPELAPVRSVLDGQARPIRTERRLPDGTLEVVTATYDPAGRITAMTLGGGLVQRGFTYDTLGRLRTSQDPDLGTRTLAWDDGDRLTQETDSSGKTVAYTYDALGRLATRNTGALYTFHYDTARPGAGAMANLGGRVAWIEEPTGGFDYSYDDLGRTAFTRRRIGTETSETTIAYAASGLPLSRTYDDGLALAYGYDPAGRLTSIGDLWQLLEQDANGFPIDEQTGNGVTTHYERDALGLTSRVTVRGHGGAALYDVKGTRNAWNGLTTIADLDGVGLDHAATFGYDAFARLTSATAGSGAAALAFGYGYDVLHNMTSRTITGPGAGTVGAFTGTYRYGEGGHGPRQLTSIAGAASQVLHTFDYDAAGRQIAQDGRALTFDAADSLLQVTGVAGGTVHHAYGADGLRLRTQAPSGALSYFFGDGTAARGGVREHDVTVGDRVVARVALSPAAATATEPEPEASAIGGVLRTLALLGPGALALAALLLAAARTARPARRRALALALISAALAPSCATSSSTSATRGGVAVVQHTTYLHAGFSPGPAVFTDETGAVIEERRHEPFGVPIGAADLAARDLNALNKRSDTATGWSDHGARWLAPETARWLTPDPPIEGPDAKVLWSPWALHPYQYVQQNPIAYWDPDGHEPRSTEYTLSVRRYAPDPTFGGGFHGDGRGPTSDPAATYRTGLHVRFDTADPKGFAVSGSAHESIIVGTLASVLVHAATPFYRWDTIERAEVAEVPTTGSRRGSVMQASSAGAMPLMWAPEINTHVSFSVQATERGLFVTGVVSGDRFPAGEVTIVDGKGNHALLGAFKELGTPYTHLWGDLRPELLRFSATIPLRSDGSFAGSPQPVPPAPPWRLNGRTDFNHPR